MAEYSLSIDDDPNQIDSGCEFLSFFPYEEYESKEIPNDIESKYLFVSGDGQLLWVRCSVDSAPAVTDSPSPLVVIRSKDPQDGNIITLSSYDNYSICEDEVPDEVDINGDVDNILKVEDRVKVFDAILAPVEKQASVKCKKRVSSSEDEDKGGNYVCDLCGSSFVRAVQYYGHLHLHSGEFLWECRLCPEVSRFGSQFQLRRHEKRYHVNLRPHTCSQCGASFDRPSQLDYHKRRIHDGERPHSCQLCGKAFFKHSDLRTHLNTHLSVHGCMCEICGRRFSHISNLTRHIRIHSGVKPYPCSVCGRRFNQLNSLNEHKTVHMNWVPISCCSKVFKTQIMFRKHLKSVHQTNNLTQQTCVGKRQFHCKVCGYSFPFLTLLRKHEMKHNQFACSGCKKDLKSLEELKDHSCNKEEVVEAEGDGGFNYDQDINETQILEDMYLDSDTDWIDPQAIVNAGSDKFDDSISPLREMRYALSCDILDENVSLCCTEVEMEEKGEGEICKPVEDICGVVPPDDSPRVNESQIEIESIIAPLDPVCSGSLMVKPQTLPQHSSNCASQVTCNSFVPASILEHSIPCGITSSLDVYSMNEDSAAVTVEEDNKCLTIENFIKVETLSGNNNYNDEGNTNTDVKDPSDGSCDDSNKPAYEDVSSKNNKDKNSIDDKTTKGYTCSVCNKQFLKACNFRQHQGIHDIGRQLYRCKVCGRSFAWKSTLNKHMLSHSENPNPTIFMCSMCDKLYTSSSVLQAHINRDHLKQRPHTCSVCKKSFFKKYDLKIHFRTHTNERPYICGTCGRGFGHISHLIRHERIHSGQRPYQCSFCPASFIQSSSLNAHQKHHVNKPDHSVCYLEFLMERPKVNES